MEIWGEHEGAPVHRLRLEGGGLTAQILTYGAVIQDLRLAGHAPPLVLGYDRFASYPPHSPNFGATVGRVANRIRHGRITVEGRAYQLEKNPPTSHTLHGGPKGIGKRVWRVEDQAPDRVRLAIDLADGEMGFPGAMRVTCDYGLAGGALDVVYRCEAEAPTLANIAQHSYFNLTGAPTVADHRLTVAADRYTPTDADLIPTGVAAPVEGTAFDFRAGRPLGAGYDVNLCLSDAQEPLRRVATLTGGDLAMDVETTEPGIQVYDGMWLNTPIPDLTGRPIQRFGGVALETQFWPDAPNNPDFPSILLKPGETRVQRTRYVFRRSAP